MVIIDFTTDHHLTSLAGKVYRLLSNRRINKDTFAEQSTKNVMMAVQQVIWSFFFSFVKANNLMQVEYMFFMSRLLISVGLKLLEVGCSVTLVFVHALLLLCVMLKY